jgi:hypothetical protein
MTIGTQRLANRHRCDESTNCSPIAECSSQFLGDCPRQSLFGGEAAVLTKWRESLTKALIEFEATALEQPRARRGQK